MARKKRSIPEINAGSMADIAFLLLIFFLVTTNIDSDKGLTMKLPPMPDPNAPIPPIKERNVLEVLINSNNLLLVENDYANITDLCETTKKHITNNGNDIKYSENPQQAIVSIKNDRGTSYDVYIMVQNELKRAYNEVRDEYSISKFGVPFADLPEKGAKYNDVVKSYPQKISEAEPANINNLD